MVVVVVEEQNNSLLIPKLIISKSQCFANDQFGHCVVEGECGQYIALISGCNVVQHGAGGYCEFLDMDFFQEVESSILVAAISFLIVKTPLLCSTDVKLSSVQDHSVHTLI